MSDTISPIINYKTFGVGQTIDGSGFPDPKDKNNPMMDAKVTQGFNDPNTTAKGHLGYDLQPVDSKAHAIFDGVVAEIHSSNDQPNGIAVCLTHQIGSCEFHSCYSHLASVATGLKEGDTISRNDIVGTMGETGNVSGPHVHLSVFIGPVTTNPMGYCSTNDFRQPVETAPNPNAPDSLPQYATSLGCCFYDPYGVISSNGAVFRYSDYSRYDVNRDGVVNQLDITRVQRYYGEYDPICDVNGDGIVDINDLILVLNNFS